MNSTPSRTENLGYDSGQVDCGGQLMGGFGSAVLEHCHAQGIRFDAVRVMGVPDRYIAHATREEQLAETGLDAAGIARVVEEERRRS